MSDLPSNSKSIHKVKAQRAILGSRRSASERLWHTVLQHPLLETRPSVQALQRAQPREPAAVFIGIGIASGRWVSRALPFDLLGLLLCGEHVRRASTARRLILLIADEHARVEGAPSDLLRARADHYERGLRCIAERCGLECASIVRASALHAQDGYRATLRQVQHRAPADHNGYVVRQVADLAHLSRLHGELIKVGWALKRSASGVERDERMFDRRCREWLQRDHVFVYAKAGRVLDDERQKMPPYLAWEPARRICLDPNEDVAQKLRWAGSRVRYSTLRGVRNHLGAIARAYGELVRPLRGSLEERTQAIIEDVVGSQRALKSRLPSPLALAAEGAE